MDRAALLESCGDVALSRAWMTVLEDRGAAKGSGLGGDRLGLFEKMLKTFLKNQESTR